MFVVNAEQCQKCGICVKNCPIGAIEAADKRQAVISEKCVECGICKKVCPTEAIEDGGQRDDAVVCTSCPVQCKIPKGSTGACKRYTNEAGRLVRNRALELNAKPRLPHDSRLEIPIVTAVGAGTSYPDTRPAPHIICENRDGVDVITAVTEVPLSYCGLTLKLDTNTYIGEEGEPVFREGLRVGMVNTEEYGSKMIAIGGANCLTGEGGFMTARTIVELANGEAVELTVGERIRMTVQAGKAPIINGVKERWMRTGCGSAAVGLLARLMKECVDECIVLDHHIVGLFTEHRAGEDVGAKWSGVIPNATKSSRGRYFGKVGNGIGGTTLKSCRDAIRRVDMSVAWPGMNILVTDTTGEIYALFEVQENGDVQEIPMSEEALRIPLAIQENCQLSRTSVLYSGGTGGSSRGGICSHPMGLTEAIHEGKAVLTIGGAPAFIYPGGGINFMVDTEKVVNKGFTWVPTPATVCPVEYTMTKADYEAIGGHMEYIKDVSEFRRELGR